MDWGGVGCCIYLWNWFCRISPSVPDVDDRVTNSTVEAIQTLLQALYYSLASREWSYVSRD